MGLYYANHPFGSAPQMTAEEVVPFTEATETQLALPANCVGMVVRATAGGPMYIHPGAQGSPYDKGLHFKEGQLHENQTIVTLWLDPADPPDIYIGNVSGVASANVAYFTIPS